MSYKKEDKTEQVLKANLAYLFDIKDKDGKNYFLTSSGNIITIGNKKYLPYSGLNLLRANFNDSGMNYVILHGIFEKNGIKKGKNLTGATVKITYLKNEKIYDLVTYICMQHLSKDLEFEIKCESEVIKYNKSLLKMFSKTCRANFGDDKCKVDIEKYIVKSSLTEIENNILTCNIENINDNYFSGGKLIIKDSNSKDYEFNIISQVGKIIEISLDNEFNFQEGMSVHLIPSCNKKFETCCDYFNNAINFQGEPHIPELDSIKS